MGLEGPLMINIQVQVSKTDWGKNSSAVLKKETIIKEIKKRDSGTGFLTKVKKANKKAHPSPVQKREILKKEKLVQGT